MGKTTVESTKYPGVYKDSRGNYFYQAYLGKDPITGKKITKKSRRSRNGKPFKSALSANIELSKIKVQYLEQSGKANYRLTLKTFMDEIFIPKYKADVLQSTFESHKKAFERIVDSLGDKKLSEITVLDCEKYRTWLLNNYSTSYANLNYVAFRQVLDFAVRMDFINQNVAKKTKAIPKGRALQSFWTKEEFESVISQCCIDIFEQHMNFMLLWLYFMTGMRVGEGQALRWSDVDFTKRIVRIYHNIDYKNKSNYKINDYTKTSSGMRTISIDRTTVKYLKRWKKAQHELIKSEFILSYDGEPIPRSTIQRIISRYSKLANVHPIQGKGLRHSHASYLINELNADVLTVSRRLGHSSPDITLKYYAHMWNRNDSVLADRMEGSINFKPNNENRIEFNGNQHIKKQLN
ncbi:tyrosine-type recombinase/integrase [Ligilactobacillus saerimneri]|uniref:tyrosine-type recombinase/integrase n=1 Tax=Ligilactobacillus saerimneri TaxID=228229 RepID=UPI0030D27328